MPMSSTEAKTYISVTLPNATTGDGTRSEEFANDDLKWHIEDGFLHIRSTSEPVAAYAPGTWVGVRRHQGRG